jgi:hypothetical protein
MIDVNPTLLTADGIEETSAGVALVAWRPSPTSTT